MKLLLMNYNSGVNCNCYNNIMFINLSYNVNNKQTNVTENRIKYIYLQRKSTTVDYERALYT
jgi:hypothetical protein